MSAYISGGSAPSASSLTTTALASGRSGAHTSWSAAGTYGLGTRTRPDPPAVPPEPDDLVDVSAPPIPTSDAPTPSPNALTPSPAAHPRVEPELARSFSRPSSTAKSAIATSRGETDSREATTPARVVAGFLVAVPVPDVEQPRATLSNGETTTDGAFLSIRAISSPSPPSVSS